MIESWRLREHRLAILILIVCLLYQDLSLCWSLNDEGLALLRYREGVLIDPCSSYGEERSDGNVVVLDNAAHRKLLQKHVADIPIKSVSSFAAHAPLPSLSSSPSPSPSPSPRSDVPYSSPSPSPAPFTAPTPNASSHSHFSLTPSSAAESPKNSVTSSNSDSHLTLILLSAIGGPMLLFALVIGIFYFRGKKVVSVRPWATGLSGQLQKAFVTGVPKLKRSELEAACEDFSNVIGSSSMGTVYKGTLSSGVEIAVTAIALTSAKEWSTNLETQFRNKIDSLSKVNHKNFVNLLGYCKEDEPFTRMLVFEYAPNGALFEHLHIKEAEHLEWAMRMRITMGIAYCLDHMHQRKPPITHKYLNSSSVYLTEDYASKVSDFILLNKVDAAEMKSNPESNVYSFGVLLFEIVTGKLPYSVDSESMEDWASDYLPGDRSLRDMVDPTLVSFQEEQIEQIHEVIKSCVNPNRKRRPQMREVTRRLREITAIGPEMAVPKLSPLWWAELEIVSGDGS